MNNQSKIRIFILVASLSVGSALAAGSNPNRIAASTTRSVMDRAGALTPNFAGRPSHHRGEKMLAIGTWGGKDINLEATKTGANIEFACAHATISGRIRLDRSGRFNAIGTNMREGPGPTRIEDERGGESMRFKGKVTGQKMELIVTNKAGGAVGTFTLTLGQTTRLRKCK